MTFSEFLRAYYLHDSLFEKVVHENDEVDLSIDFCFWMQDGYREEDPETGIIHLHIPNVTSFTGPTGDIEGYSILEADCTDDCLSLLIMDDFNNKSYEMKIVSPSGKIVVKF